MAKFGMGSTQFDRIGAELEEFCSAEIVQLLWQFRPISVKVVQGSITFGPSSTEFGPKSTKLGPNSTKSMAPEAEERQLAKTTEQQLG